MSISGIGGGAGYNPYVVMNTSQQSQGMQKPTDGPPSQEEAFSRANTDGDEYISSAEMASMFSMGQSQELSEEGMAMYAEADVDGDGQLSETEFNTKIEELAQQAPPPPMDGQMPTDGGKTETDSSVTADLSQVMSLVGNASSQESASTSSTASSDEEEELSAMEILANQMADARDLDGDGEVTSSESAEYKKDLEASQSSDGTQSRLVADPDKLSKTGVYQAIADMADESDLVESQAMYA